MDAVRIEEATVGGPTLILGRPSATRAEWESARAADAADLNRLIENGGEVEAYVVPLWSNVDAPRCLQELQGFDEAQVYVEFGQEVQEDVLALLAETQIGAAHPGESLQTLVPLLHAAASLDIPLYLPQAPTALKALALTLAEDLTPREIEAALKGEWPSEPDAESLDHAKELLA